MSFQFEKDSSALVAVALQHSLDRYMEKRRECIASEWVRLISIRNCFAVQGHSFVQDLVCNPLNTLWAIPYVSIHKVLETFHKIGVELAGMIAPKVPSSIKTGFQREMERQFKTEIFGLDTKGTSDLARELSQNEHLKAAAVKPEWKKVVSDAEADIHKAISDFCDRHNGLTDLAASGAVLLVAQQIFRDRSLDIFGISKRWAARWAHQDAVSHFVFGRKLGGLFYQVVPAPAATSHQIFWATVYSMGLLALFSTVVTIVSYPTQHKLGLQKKQLETLIQNIEDKLLLRFAKYLQESRKIQSAFSDLATTHD